VEITSLYREPKAEAKRDWPALELLDVYRIYASGPVETVALRGLSLEVRPREVVAVYGPSGSGKSTFLHLAAGLDVPSAGEVRSFGRSLGRLSDDALAGYRAREIAVVFQRDNLWSTMTAQENVEESLRLAGVRGAGQPARRALEAFGLADRRAHRVTTLSGGEQQRVAIAAAAARRARIVLADEPTGELDVANEGVVIDALLRLRDAFDSTVVVVTHSPRLADAADRVVELRDGRAVA
jgi:putative ABC transport system ATP-binding protein